jgi:hypothetical protein
LIDFIADLDSGDAVDDHQAIREIVWTLISVILMMTMIDAEPSNQVNQKNHLKIKVQTGGG